MVKVTLDVLGEKIEGTIIRLSTKITGEESVDILFPAAGVGMVNCDDVKIEPETVIKIIEQMQKEAKK